MEKKITVQCCVPGCHNTNHMTPQILFFPFPKRQEMQEKWLSAIRRPELKKILPTDKPFHMFICLDHFRPNDVVQINQRTCLRAGVIPSVFKWSEKDVSLKSDSITHSSKPTLTNVSSRVRNSITDDIIYIHCGNLNAELHRNKFYCPGIHRECIKYNNQFITPKMFMIMGDKERLKDWKNAIRIEGIKIRKFIENKQIDFYKHKEFCTGRCVARLPTNLFRTRSQPPDAYVNTSGDISNVRFAAGDKKPETVSRLSLSIEPIIETEIDEENDDSDESLIDEKPDIETLNALLKAPIPKTMLTKGQGQTSDHGITDNQIFWKGIVKLGFIGNCFDIVSERLSQLQASFHRDVRAEDAHILSCLVREMGLSNKIQHMLASSKQEMDVHYNKLEEEMQELRQKVSQYENRKILLKKRSEEFKAILDMNNPKNNNNSSYNLENDCLITLADDTSSPSSKRTAELTLNDTNVKRLKLSNSENLKRILQAPQQSDSSLSSMVKPGQILKIIPSQSGGLPKIIHKIIDADSIIESPSPMKDVENEDVVEEDAEDSIKIVSVESIKDQTDFASTHSSEDMKTVEDIQNVVANGQELNEKILKSTSKEEDEDEDDIDDDDLLETLETYGDGQDSSSQMKIIRDPDNPNSQLIIWKRSDGVAETFRFSNNADDQSDDDKPNESENKTINPLKEASSVVASNVVASDAVPSDAVPSDVVASDANHSNNSSEILELENPTIKALANPDLGTTSKQTETNSENMPPILEKMASELSSTNQKETTDSEIESTSTDLQETVIESKDMVVSIPEMPQLTANEAEVPFSAEEQSMDAPEMMDIATEVSKNNTEVDSESAKNNDSNSQDLEEQFSTDEGFTEITTRLRKSKRDISSKPVTDTSVNTSVNTSLDEMSDENIAMRRSSRKRIAKVKEDL